MQDFERQYSVGEIKDIKDEIRDIRDKIKTLQSDYRKLSKRMDNLEILGIQDQLNSLHDSLLETQRFLARIGISYASTNLLYNVQQQKPAMAKKIFAQLTADASAARKEATISTKPLSILKQFHDKCYEDQKEWGIKIIDIH
jgi:septal ring factor EnvC (AmiA/AmiB activator)